jgi:hypothetical protein
LPIVEVHLEKIIPNEEININKKMNRPNNRKKIMIGIPILFIVVGILIKYGKMYFLMAS